jgi:hypothetical protein
MQHFNIISPRMFQILSPKISRAETEYQLAMGIKPLEKSIEGFDKSNINEALLGEFTPKDKRTDRFAQVQMQAQATAASVPYLGGALALAMIARDGIASAITVHETKGKDGKLGTGANVFAAIPFFARFKNLGSAAKAYMLGKESIQIAKGAGTVVDDFANGLKIEKTANIVVKDTQEISNVTKLESQVLANPLENAKFAQISYSNNFSKEGSRMYSQFAGKPINTVDDLASALKDGSIKPSQVKVDYIIRDGNVLILNTRTSQALTKAGIPRSQWNAVNKTGEKMFEQMLDNQLYRSNLTSKGMSEVKLKKNIK